MQNAMTSSRATLVELIHRYLEAFLDPFITWSEFHRLMYFMQEAGEPLGLEYKYAPPGIPHGKNLRLVLCLIEGCLIVGPAGDPILAPGVANEAVEAMKQHDRASLDRVSRLIEGFESPDGLELLTTVHWALSHEGETTGWDFSKQPFSPRQIAIAEKRLKAQDWLPTGRSVITSCLS